MKDYVYILVKPKSTDHPMNMVLTVGHYLYEVRNYAFNNNLDFNELEVWRMRSGEVKKDKLDTWMGELK